MAEIVNLRRALKDKARRDREVEADANRRRFGRTKSQKAVDKQDEARTRRTLDGKLIDKE